MGAVASCTSSPSNSLDGTEGARKRTSAELGFVEGNGRAALSGCRFRRRLSRALEIQRLDGSEVEFGSPSSSESSKSVMTIPVLPIRYYNKRINERQQELTIFLWLVP